MIEGIIDGVMDVVMNGLIDGVINITYEKLIDELMKDTSAMFIISTCVTVAFHPFLSLIFNI